VPLSAKSEAALAALLARVAEHVDAHPELSLADLAHTARVGRGHFAHRAAVIAKDRPEFLVNLGRAARGQAGRVRVAFLFTGQGAQYAGMGQALYAAEPVFREVLDRCAKALADVLDRDLRHVMFDGDSGLLEQTRYAQPALYALEVGLARLWQSWGVEPALVLGHSVGEYAAACIAGVYDIETGARLIAERGLRMQELPGSGAMLAVQGERESVERVVAALLDREREVSLAARNAPGSVVLSGPQGALERAIDPLTREGLTTRRLAVSHAFHSSQMAPMLARFEAFAMNVPHHAPRITWVSNLTGEALNTAEWSGRMGEYWRRHVREPVQFERGVETAAAQGIDVFVEVGPHPVLCGLGRATLTGQPQLLWIESLRRNVPAEETLVSSVGRLYVRGATIDWRAFDRERGGRIVAFPTYPFQRQRYWLDETPRTVRRPAATDVHPLLGARLDRAGVRGCFERTVTPDDPEFLRDHRIGGQIVMPMTAYLEMALAAARIALESESVVIEGLTLDAPLVFGDNSTRTLQVLVDDADQTHLPHVRVFSKGGASTAWTLHASAQIFVAEPRHLTAQAGPSAVEHRGERLDCTSLYAKLRDLGVEFGPAFLGLQSAARIGERATLGRVVAPPSVRSHAKGYLCHPAVLDACLHVAAFALASDTDDEHIYLPVGFDRFVLLRQLPDVLSSTVHLREGTTGQATASLDLRVYAESGEPVAVLEGVRCRRMTRDFFAASVTKDIQTLTYRVAWRPFDVPMTIPAIARGAWVVLEDADGAGAAAAEELSARGAYVVRVTPGPGFRILSKERVEIDPLCAEDHARLLAHAARRAPLKGVVDLWPLRVPELTSADQPSDLQTFGASSALLLAQAATARTDAADLGLWLVTRGAQATGEQERVRCEQAPVWGLGKVVGLEHPEMRTTLIDLDGAAPATEAVPALMAVVLGATDEPQIALRGARCLRARLTPLQTPRHSPAQSLPVVKSAGTYLVTGGLGGLGLLAAEWLIEQGARHLVLAGRRAPDKAARGTIDRLCLRGATITVVQGDVSTEAGVEELLRASGRSLKGILHCAGVLADGVLAQQSPGSLSTVLRPKADGAWRLHTRVRELAISLDFFVSFSSLSAVMGAAAQANYVAANSFLDALASERRAHGLPALSIGWGSWADAGMAARADVVDRFAAQGIRPLHAAEAFATLTALMRGCESHVAVAPIEWKTLSQQLRGVRAARLLEELFDSAPAGDRAPSHAATRITPAALARLDRGTRLQALRDLVRSSVSGVLRLRRADGELVDEQSFATLGLDSLTAIELRNALHAQLGLRLAPTVGFDHPTLGALASHLNQLLEATLANEPVETSAAAGEREEVTL
jgi:acyl transferase domain-containing protein/acyl carrier protein